MKRSRGNAAAMVYRGVVRADVSDLRVFNGAGEVVPHAFRPRRPDALRPESCRP